MELPDALTRFDFRDHVRARSYGLPNTTSISAVRRIISIFRSASFSMRK